MILHLSEDCPVFQEEAEMHLQRLLLTVADKRWHLIAWPNPDRLEEILPLHLWRVYGDFLRQSYKRVINSAQPWSKPTACSSCEPQKLATFFDLPVVLLVENAESDGAWIKLVMGTLKPRLRSCLNGQHPQVHIRQAGGIGEIPKELERIAPEYARVKPEGVSHLRIVVFADSDSKRPGSLSTKARDVIKVAEGHGASVHILRKRSIENYIPIGSLQEYAKKRPNYRDAISYITKLTPTQRDHYPFKTGLTANDLSDPDTLYSPGSRVGVKLGDFILDFISEFGMHVRADELTATDGVGELDHLIGLIEEVL
jgi:hypothetical protein